MKKWVKVIVTIGVVLLLLLAIGPFLVPIPPLEDTVPPQALADPDSQFVEVEGVTLHTKMDGEGTPALVLLHGFGASIYSWREVMEPLAEDAQVVAFDRPAFGLTERPLPGDSSWPGYNPYTGEAQVDLTVGLMDALGIPDAVLVGNSAGGTVAAETALAYPDRVRALILVDAAIYTGGGSPAWVRPLLNTPQMGRLGPLLARGIQSWGRDFGRSAWHDPSKIPSDYWEHYERPLQAQHWDRGLWQLTRSSRPSTVPDRLDDLTMPVLVITGDDDRIVPTEQSVQLAAALPNAELVVIPACGHVPQEECPAPWLAAVETFLNSLPED
jgi:pimeloyl-ACP methyl ester carboxylesterase